MLLETTKIVKIHGVPPKGKGSNVSIRERGECQNEYKISQLHFHVTHMFTPMEKALNKHSLSPLLD